MSRDTFVKRLEPLILCARQLTKLMRDFEEVIIKENQAIARSDINELELITQEKTYFGAKVGDAVHDIRRHIEQLRKQFKLESQQPSEITIDKVLVELEEYYQKSFIGDGDFRRALSMLGEAVSELRAARETVFPKIEANAYLVKKLLQYHRETYAFWQSVANESEAVYGKTGKAKTSSQKSILSVRT